MNKSWVNGNSWANAARNEINSKSSENTEMTLSIANTFNFFLDCKLKYCFPICCFPVNYYTYTGQVRRTEILLFPEVITGPLKPPFHRVRPLKSSWGKFPKAKTLIWYLWYSLEDSGWPDVHHKKRHINETAKCNILF